MEDLAKLVTDYLNEPDEKQAAQMQMRELLTDLVDNHPYVQACKTSHIHAILTNGVTHSIMSNPLSVLYIGDIADKVDIPYATAAALVTFMACLHAAGIAMSVAVDVEWEEDDSTEETI